MRTIYIAAEKLVSWTPSGEITVHQPLTNTLTGSRSEAAYVVYFVPERFGLYFEDRTESELAWQYFANALERAGFWADQTICFEHALESRELRAAIESRRASEISFFSDASEDRDLSHALGLETIEEMPVSSQSDPVRHTMRALINAALKL